jgi:general secretion pathway protein D
MNLRISVAAGLLAALPMFSMAADDRPADPTYVALSELVARVHKKTNRDFILDQAAASARVSLAGMDAERVDYPKLLAVLRYNGFVTIDEKEAVTILPDATARQMATAILTADDPKISGDAVITRVVQVRNACAAHMVPVLRPLMPQYAHMAAYPPTNTLILVDRADNIRRVVDVIERIDKAAPAKLSCGEFSKSGS